MNLKEVQDFMTLISTIAGNMKALNPAFEAAKGMILSSTKKKNLLSLQEKIISLQDEIVKLEQKANTIFPQLSQLISLYSELIADIRAAKAVSDKAAELLAIVPELTVNNNYAQFFIRQIDSDFNRIDSKTTQLPSIDNLEKGKLDEKLRIIRDFCRDLKQCEQNNISGLKVLFNNISTYYSDLESIMGRFLKKILESLEPTNK